MSGPSWLSFQKAWGINKADHHVTYCNKRLHYCMRMHHAYKSHLGCCLLSLTPPPCNYLLPCSITFSTEVREGPWQCLLEMLLLSGHCQCPKGTDPLSHSPVQGDLGSDPRPIASYGMWHPVNDFTLWASNFLPLLNGGHKNMYGTRLLHFELPRTLDSRF